VGVANSQYRWQSDLDQAAGDRFVTNGATLLSPAAALASGGPTTIVRAIGLANGPNILSANQDRFNEIPSIMPWETNNYVPESGATKMDDMDALEITEIDQDGDGTHDTPIFFSLDATSSSLGTDSQSDIFLSTAGATSFGLFAAAQTMGLDAINDELDALAVWDLGTSGSLDMGVDLALFSLAPDSATLIALNASPADIFITDFSDDFQLFLSHADLGLLFTDNLNALDVEPVPDSIDDILDILADETPDRLPLPSSLLLVLLGALSARLVIGKRTRGRAA
jgi:hypothetical protein